MLNKKKLFFKLALLILVYVIIRAPSFASTEIENDLNKILEKFRIEYNVPAIAASVIKFDTIHYSVTGSKKYGSANKVDINSKFHLGSNTKAITSFIAAKLVENDLLKWDVPLLNLLPELKSHIHNNYKNITLEKLLSHRTGILPFEDDGSKEWKKLPKNIAENNNQRLVFAQYALGLKPKFSKKANHSYSNGGYIIAALMMEKASGKSWEILIDEYFNQFGIDYYVGFPSQQNINNNHGHVKKGKKYKAVKPEKEFHLDDYFAPAGNLSLSLKGFSQFIHMNLRGLMGEDNYLKSTTYQKLHFGQEQYAYGWYNGKIGQSDQKFSYHGGSLGTFSSAVIISADRKVAIIILVNADNKKVNQLKNALRKVLWGKYGENLNEK